LGKAEVSASAIKRRGPAIEYISTRVPKPRNEHTCARVHKKRIDRICDQVRMACDRAHLCVKPKSSATLLLRVLFLGFLQLGINTTIFRVSRVSLDSINRLVNTKKHTRDFGEEFTTLKEAIFWVYSFPCILFYEND
jgi:hypothetical protein